MNSTHASNGANASAALSTQRLLDGRQLGNGGREQSSLAGSDGPDFAAMLKGAQQASGGASRETAPSRPPAEPVRRAAAPPDAPDAREAAGALAQARRADPLRTPAPQTRATEATRERTAHEHKNAAAEADPAKPAAGSADAAPQPSSPVKAKARISTATAAAAEAAPKEAVAAAPASTIALPEEALRLAPSTLQQAADPEQELNQSLAAPPALQSAPLPPTEAAVLPTTLPGQEDAPSLQAPSNALPLAPSRRAIGAAAERGQELSALAGMGSKSNETRESASKPSASSSTATALPERAVGTEAQAQTSAAPGAGPHAMPALLTSVIAEQRTKAEAQVDASMVKGTFSLAGLASTPAPSLQPTPTGNVQATVHAPLASPAFADELGAQVAIWSRQGVQEAELRLNPAEMGPVHVRIQLEGQVAQVRFVAEQGATRDALQAAMPELVQALSKEGLQWGGGDVQSQAQQQAQQNNQQNSQQSAQHNAQQQADGRSNGQAQQPWRSATGLGGEPQMAPRPPGQRVGLLDLYA